MYEEIYAKNKGLLIEMARQYAWMCELDRAVTMEDLTQAGFIGLVRASKTFDESVGKTWASWATWQIRREIEIALGLHAGRVTRAHTGAVSLDRPLIPGNGDGETLGDLLADESAPKPDARLLLDELRRDVRDAVDRLKDDGQRRAVRLCRLEGRSYREAAADMGITPQRARRLCDRAGMRLARDRALLRLMDLDERTRFHAHKGVAAFNRDWTSVTEGAALWRIGEQEKLAGPQ